MKQQYRVFSFADRKCPTQPTGGPGGVNYRLYHANEKYHYIENLCCIFSDKILEKGQEKPVLQMKIDEDTTKLIEFLRTIHKEYDFKPNDVYIFHDILTATVFLKMFNYKNTMVVYHQQGTLYMEWYYSFEEEDLEYKKTIDKWNKFPFEQVKFLAFPSKGSIESVIESDPSYDEVIHNADVKILYNGCTPEVPEKAVTEEAKALIQVINENAVPSFITVAALNDAKGVERIPEFLAKVKEKYGQFIWIVVGDGVKAKAFMENVGKYGIQEETYYVDKRIPNGDIQLLYQNTDFYILTHRISIFDYATIEAMHAGNIPILTPIGGNKEMIREDNGIFINDFTSCKDFDEFMEQQDINEAREKNVRIAQELFSESAFLKGYADLISEMCS